MRENLVVVVAQVVGLGSQPLSTLKNWFEVFGFQARTQVDVCAHLLAFWIKISNKQNRRQLSRLRQNQTND